MWAWGVGGRGHVAGGATCGCVGGRGHLGDTDHSVPASASKALSLSFRPLFSPEAKEGGTLVLPRSVSPTLALLSVHCPTISPFPDESLRLSLSPVLSVRYPQPGSHTHVLLRGPRGEDLVQLEGYRLSFMQQVDNRVVIGIEGHCIGRLRSFPILFGDRPDTSNHPNIP